MIVEYLIQTPNALASFAEEHGLTLGVYERLPKDMGDRWTEAMRYYSCFQCADIKEGNMPRPTCGNGATPTKAVRNYLKKISGAHLVVDAGTSRRRDIQVPDLQPPFIG